VNREGGGGGMNVAAFDEKVVNNDDLKNICQQVAWNDIRG